MTPDSHGIAIDDGGDAELYVYRRKIKGDACHIKVRGGKRREEKEGLTPSVALRRSVSTVK